MSGATDLVSNRRESADTQSTLTPDAATKLDGRRRILDVPLGSITRPSWRGRSHLFALVVAVPLLAAMTTQADGARAGAGLLIYAGSLCSMLLASTTYHRWVHTVRWRTIWRRADHAMIFAAIAGTYTPLALALLPTTAAIATLAVVWSAALVGATIKLANWQRADPVATAMYVTNGWAGLVLIPARRGGAVRALRAPLLCGPRHATGTVRRTRHPPMAHPPSCSTIS